MTASIAHLLPLQVRSLPGTPLQIESAQRTWMHKPFRLHDAAGKYVGEIVHSTAPEHGIADVEEAKAMAIRVAAATACHEMLLVACKAVSADLQKNGTVSLKTAEMVHNAIDLAHRVERLVQA